MVKKIYWLTVWLGLSLNSVPALAQKTKAKLDSMAVADAGTSELVFPDLEHQLISLDSIVDIAIENSPFLKYDSTMTDVTKMDVKLAKREWQRYIMGFGNYTNGNQTFFLPSDMQTNTNSVLNGYRYGVNINIPLSEFTNRKLKIRQSQSEVEAQMYKKEQTELGLRRQVVQEYNNLIAAQKLLKIKSESLENFRVLKQLGEKQFREGTISLEDYALVSDMAVKAEADYELAKGSFRTIYVQFEELIGVKLSTLMKRR